MCLFWGFPTHADFTEFSNFFLQLKNQRSGNKTVCGFSVIFYFKRNHDVLNSLSPCFLLNKNIKFNKNETESKMENPTQNFREITHVLQYASCASVWKLLIKRKTVMSWSLRKRKECILCNVYFVQRNFF